MRLQGGVLRPWWSPLVVTKLLARTPDTGVPPGNTPEPQSQMVPPVGPNTPSGGQGRQAASSSDFRPGRRPPPWASPDTALWGGPPSGRSGCTETRGFGSHSQTLAIRQDADRSVPRFPHLWEHQAHDGIVKTPLSPGAAASPRQARCPRGSGLRAARPAEGSTDCRGAADSRARRKTGPCLGTGLAADGDAGRRCWSLRPPRRAPVTRRPPGPRSQRGRSRGLQGGGRRRGGWWRARRGTLGSE